MPIRPITVDRAAGVLLGQACGDALGVPYELAAPPVGEAVMKGGGLGPYEPGEWSDDTQMTLCVARVAADGLDLSTPEDDVTTLVFNATDVLTGPGTADEQVPDDKKAAVLAAFGTRMPGMKLPFGLAPTTEGARGSDIIIEGISTGVTVALDGFRQS